MFSQKLEGCEEGAAFNAAMALFIIRARFEWDFPLPLADEFMRDDSALPPKGVSVVTILQIAHFLEQRVLLRKDLALPALASKEDPESGSEDAGS